VSIRYIELVDYLAIAVEITGLDATTLTRVAKIDLVESALHAPAAGFGETEFYPDFIEKAAVLVVHLAKNHPLPDGNKRAAWVALRLFVAINDWTWHTTRPSMTPSKPYWPSPPVHGAKTTWPRGCDATSRQPPQRRRRLAPRYARQTRPHRRTLRSLPSSALIDAMMPSPDGNGTRCRPRPNLYRLSS
jgi:death-on-curing protein